MTLQRNLWDCLDDGKSKEEALERADRENTRRRAYKRLSAGGHWLALLRVARAIPQPFTLNDVSVAVWKAHPEAFGMNGYPYPDNHKVHYILYGARGLIAKGIIRRVSQGIFQVAEGVDPDALLAADPAPRERGAPEGGRPASAP